MSRWGRWEDGLYDLLFGYQHGMTGEIIPGPLPYDTPWPEKKKLIDEINHLANTTILYIPEPTDEQLRRRAKVRAAAAEGDRLVHPERTDPLAGAPPSSD